MRWWMLYPDAVTLAAILSTLALGLFTGSAGADTSLKLFPVDDSPSAIARLKEQVADVLALSERAMLSIVPEQSGIYFTDCPNCDKASQDWGNFEWVIEQPASIRCKDCDEIYPDNPKYPDSQVLEVRSIDGMHRYPYYTRPSDGYKIYFRGRADYFAREHMARRCQQLAELWWVTREEVYARRAALILVRFAQVYPGYALHYDYPFREKKIVPYDHESLTPNEGPRTAKWSWWGYMDIARELTIAYDAIRYWEPLSQMAGGQAAVMIERDLLGGMLEYTMALGETYSNMSPVKWRAAIEAARVLDRPEMVHESVERLEKFLEGRFLYDGSWMETSPSYVQQVVGLMDVIRTSLRGYADAPEYRHPRTGRNLRAADVESLLDLRDRIIATLQATCFPDGRLIPINDTWSTGRVRPRQTMAAWLSPGFGVAVMGGGEGERQFHAYLNFTGGASHNQWATLSIGLWAHGKELLSDLGYTHTKYRYWTLSTASHNTVMVDGTDQKLDRQHTGNRLRTWVSDGRAFHAVEAESVTAYPQTSRFRRTLLTVGREASEAYLVDVFQVHGGSQHDYILAGNADEDSTAAIADLPLKPFGGTLLNEGVNFTFPTGEHDLNRPATGLGFLRDLQHARVGDMATLDYRLTGSPSIGTRTWLSAGADTTVYLGVAPSIRRAGRVDAAVDQYVMPMLVARRQGKQLKSTFVAVHEPVNGEPTIQTVSVQRRPNVVIVTVERAETTDYLLVAVQDQATARVIMPRGAIDFSGRHAMVRVKADEVVEAHLVGGSHLRMGSLNLEAPAAFKGNITEPRPEQTMDSHGWFMVNESIPADAPAKVLLARLPDGAVQGYNVVRLEPQPKGTRIVVRETPGFKYSDNGIETTFFPQREIKGRAVSYELITAVHHVAAP